MQRGVDRRRTRPPSAGRPAPARRTRRPRSPARGARAPSRRARRAAPPATRSGVDRSVRLSRRPDWSRIPARIFVPPRSIPITRLSATSAGTLLCRMAPDEKPYRVYRGGRVKGKVPAVPGKPRPRAGPGRGTAAERLDAQRGVGRGSGASLEAHRPDHRCSCSSCSMIVWGVTAFLSFQSGVSDANKRFDRERGARAALAKSNGFLLSHGTTILLLGTDSSTAAGRSGDRHADSIMLVRTDPSAPPALVPLDPARPARQRARARQHEDQRGLPGRRRPARDQDGEPVHRGRDRPRRHRRLQQLQGPDRRRGRDHDQRARADPLEPLRLPVQDRRRAASSGRAGGSSEAAST